MQLYLFLALVLVLVSADVTCCVGSLCVNSQTDLLQEQSLKYLCGDDVENCDLSCHSLSVPSPFNGPCSANGDQEGIPLCESLGCVSRQTVLAHGKRWVDLHIPYSQSKTFEGYRTDCSGFVSMAWGLSKPGLTTRTISSVSRSISKNDLREGDALLGSGHVVLFVKWANSAHTQYLAYEESSSKGSVARVTPYPYWSGSFSPIRYNNIC
ncbi:hypothetical protein GEMRC1_008266 [Eukaryota sp. GEM-RC1]